MFNNLIFIERLKFIRNKWNLTYIDLSRYCTVFNKYSIGKSTLNMWETGKRIPTVDNLQIVADIFGVSIDWLIGRSAEMYTEGSIYTIEQKLFPLNVSICDTTVELPIEIPDDYINYEIRKQTYSLESRASIVFLLYVFKYEWERYVGDNISEFTTKDISALKLHAYKMFHYFMINQSNRNRMEDYHKTLENIFRNKSI